MNYYNPYLYSMPASSPGLIKSIFGSGASIGTFLTNAQKVISTINQTIPAIKQITPVVKNAKTMFSVMNEFKKVDNPSASSTKINNRNTNNTNNINKSIINYSNSRNNSTRNNNNTSIESNIIERGNNNIGPNFFI